MINTYDYIQTNTQSWWYDRAATLIGRKYFGEDAPYANELMKKISLVFVNSHFSFDQPRPWIPNLVEIGGIHVTNPKPLPKVTSINILKKLTYNLKYSGIKTKIKYFM